MSRDVRSIHDIPVLRLVHEHGAITLQAVAHHLRGRHGRDESYLLQCVRDLAERGLLTRRPYGLNKGRASRRVLELTDAGQTWLGLPAMANPYRRGPHTREYQIARSTAMLDYLALGCLIVHGREVYEALRSHAMGSILAGHDRDAKGSQLERLRNATGYDMRLEAVVGPNGGVGLVLPVYQGLSWRGVLGRLTESRDAGGKVDDDAVKRSSLGQVAAVAPLHFLLLGTVPSELKAAQRGVERWMKDVRIPATTSTLPLWMMVGFPTEAHRPPLHPAHKTPDAPTQRQGAEMALA